MTSHRVLRRLLLVTVCAWGIVWGPVDAAILGETGARDDRIEMLPIAEGNRVIKDDRRQGWLKIQWAGLTPEQREQLRDQVREHRQRSREEFHRDDRRDVYRAPSDPSGGRQQRLSPDEREEFRQWMRERQGGRNGRGRGQ